MRAALPGTRHSTTLHSHEQHILQAIQQAPGVRKLETLGFKRTGPKPRRLELRVARSPGIRQLVIDGRLSIGSAVRRLTICPRPGVSLAALGRELEAALARYRVAVEILTEEDTMSEQLGEHNTFRQPALTIEQHWGYCVAIHDLVETAKAYKAEEEDLELRLEEVRDKKQQTQQQALEVLAKALEPHT